METFRYVPPTLVAVSTCLALVAAIPSESLDTEYRSISPRLRCCYINM